MYGTQRYHDNIYVNGEKEEQVIYPGHLDQSLSITDKTSMITVVVSSLWKSFNLFMAKVRTHLLNSIVALLAHLCGVYIIMNQFVLLGEKH